ncbi:GDSL esterase/lipase EXL3-like [Rutidosis leptorrhynchoides]|uniref:GDSL esterase/lipase EXL3-like n=1 Tax=Rutidosis leptorrhynchoides TaxID=125765 RepID=UPI003A9A02AA
MIPSVVKVVVVSLYVSLCLCRNTVAIALPEHVVVPAVFTFGDSQVDQGNNNNVASIAKGNYPPYGKDFPGAIPTGRFSNGKTLSDVFANAFGVKEYLPAYLDPLIHDKDLLTGVSFASGAAGYDPETSKAGTALSMATQLDMFKEYIQKLKTNVGEEATNNIITNSVFLVVVGGNDLQVSYYGLPTRRLQYDIRGYSKFLVTLALDYVQELQNLGARRIGVFGIPVLGCVPTQRTMNGGLLRSCADNINAAAQLFNEMLKQELQNYKSSFLDSKVAFVDYYNPYMNIIQNPHNYGLEVVDKGCCGTGEIETIYLCNKLTPLCHNSSDHLFWDGFHLSETGCNIIVNIMISDMVNSLF